jgi:hypothetical protein
LRTRVCSRCGAFPASLFGLCRLPLLPSGLQHLIERPLADTGDALNQIKKLFDLGGVEVGAERDINKDVGDIARWSFGDRCSAGIEIELQLINGPTVGKGMDPHRIVGASQDLGLIATVGEAFERIR